MILRNHEPIKFLKPKRMSYPLLRATSHYNQAEKCYKKALEFRLKGNLLLADEYMRQAHIHTEKAEYYTAEVDKSIEIQLSFR